MNTQSLTTKALSAVILFAAVALGAGFGSFTSTDASANAEPASAVTEYQPSECSLVCVSTSTGGGGNLPVASAGR